jgi:hypothetical protein
MTEPRYWDIFNEYVDKSQLMCWRTHELDLVFTFTVLLFAQMKNPEIIFMNKFNMGIPEFTDFKTLENDFEVYLYRSESFNNSRSFVPFFYFIGDVKKSPSWSWGLERYLENYTRNTGLLLSPVIKQIRCSYHLDKSNLSYCEQDRVPFDIVPFAKFISISNIETFKRYNTEIFSYDYKRDFIP